MIADLALHLAAQFGQPVDEAIAGVRFVLGPGIASNEKLDQNQIDLVTNYFYSMYGHLANVPTRGDEVETLMRLTIKRWRQFGEVDLDLSSQLTIITGENGTGKTSILNLLGGVFGSTTQFVGTPSRDKNGFRFRQGSSAADGEFEQIGVLTFSSGVSSKIGVREFAGSYTPHFTPELAPYRGIPGLYLDAQQMIGPYEKLESIPPRFNSAREIAESYGQQLRNLFIPHRLTKSPALLIKEALVAAALYGEGNSMVVGDPRAAEVWNGFQSLLMQLFPESLGFKRLMVDQGEIVIETGGGPFALEASSGGVAAIVSIAWQIYLHVIDSPTAFTVCFDEPENHLHPSLQRTLLPSLMAAFPAVKFIVATHSPFVVTSTRSARVYAMRRGAQGSVVSEQIDFDNKAVAASDVLDEVLGVSVTIPIWAEQDLKSILREFTENRQEKTLTELSRQLRTAGLNIAMPEVTDAIATAIERDRGQGTP